MNDRRINIFQVLKQEGKLETLHVYAGIARSSDPYEKKQETTLLNPVPVKALIHSIGFSSLHWKYWGHLPVGSIQVIIEPKDKNLLLTARKIKYQDNFYKVYKEDSQNFQYIERKDYIVFILGLTND